MSEHVDNKQSDAESDMTPMVDVTFLLLIFFMVTAAFALQNVLDVPPLQEKGPGEAEQAIEQPDVIVEVDQFNTFYVLTAAWEREAPSEHELLVILREARAEDADGTSANRLLVKAHEDSLHEKVVAALDSGAAVGMHEVLLATMSK